MNKRPQRDRVVVRGRSGAVGPVTPSQQRSVRLGRVASAGCLHHSATRETASRPSSSRISRQILQRRRRQHQRRRRHSSGEGSSCDSDDARRCRAGGRATRSSRHRRPSSPPCRRRLADSHPRRSPRPSDNAANSRWPPRRRRQLRAQPPYQPRAAAALDQARFQRSRPQPKTAISLRRRRRKTAIRRRCRYRSGHCGARVARWVVGRPVRPGCAAPPACHCRLPSRRRRRDPSTSSTDLPTPRADDEPSNSDSLRVSFSSGTFGQKQNIQLL